MGGEQSRCITTPHPVPKYATAIKILVKPLLNIQLDKQKGANPVGVRPPPQPHPEWVTFETSERAYKVIWMGGEV